MQISNGLFTYNQSMYRKNNMSVNFGAMKKSQFDGIDYAVVEKFKAPIEKFNSNENFQIWADIQTGKILNKKHIGRQTTTTIMREKMLAQWEEGLTTLKLSSAEKFLILQAITKELLSNNDNIPPNYNPEILTKTLKNLKYELDSNRNYQFDFNKIYKKELRKTYLNTDTNEKNSIMWKTIPSYRHDSENFKQNVEILKTISNNRWCTKASLAEPYLRSGDFHILLNNNEPELALRFEDNTLKEIQGDLNNGTIPQRYFKILDTYIKDNDFTISESIKKELDEARKRAILLEEIKTLLSDAIKNNNIEEILSYFNYSYEKNPDGLLTLKSGYFQPLKGISWKDLGIDENNILKKVKEIDGYCDLTHSDATNLGNVSKIDGYLNVSHSKLTSLGNLEYVESIKLSHSKIKTLGKLKHVSENAIFTNSNLTDLGDLEYIGNNADFLDSKITSLGKLKYIGNNANFANTSFTDSGNLKYIGGDANFFASKIETLTNLKSIGGNAIFKNSNIKYLGNLESIGGYADFYNSKLISLDQLKSIQGSAVFGRTPLRSLKNLEYIGGNIRFTDTNISDIGALNHVGKDVYFSDSQITTLNNLQKIDGNASFANSLITNLDKLLYIKGNADFSDSNINNFGELRFISGNAIFDYGKIPHNRLFRISGNIIERSAPINTNDSPAIHTNPLGIRRLFTAIHDNH